MYIILVFLSAGVIMICYGIREQKSAYGNPHYTTASVVGHERVRSSSLGIAAMNALAGMVHPVVEFVNEDGALVRAVLHTQILRASLSQMPELNVGGEVDILYFGDRPRQCFLQNHQLAQKVSRTSAALVGGILLLLLAATFIGFYYAL